LPAVDINAGVSTDVFSMKDCSHATIIISMGVTGGASTVTVEECDNFTPSTHTEIAFNVYKEETDAGDTLGARTAVSASGFATSTNNNITYVIEIDAEDLTEGYPNLRLSFSNPGNATYASAVAILTGLSYQEGTTRTQIA
jgi:hypothetical protein